MSLISLILIFFLRLTSKRRAPEPRASRLGSRTPLRLDAPCAFNNYVYYIVYILHSYTVRPFIGQVVNLWSVGSLSN